MKQAIGRRKFITGLAILALSTITGIKETFATMIEKLVLTEREWRQRLTPEQFRVLRDEGTEAPRSSSLNDEKRQGIFHCAGCDLPLFSSDKKFESGTGWPSFFDMIAGHVATRTDYRLIWPRTEYHCTRCGGHQGHIFNDGPQPTGLRYCNNGVALKFKANKV